MRFKQDEIDLTGRFKARSDILVPGISVDWGTIVTHEHSSGVYEGLLLRFRVSRLPDSRFVATQGAIKHYRNYGTVLMQVVGPINEGPGRILEVADKVSGIFMGWRSGGMHGKTSSAGPVIEDKSKASVTVSTPYQSDFKVNAEGIVLPWVP